MRFDQFHVGQEFNSRPHTVTGEELLAFPLGWRLTSAALAWRLLCGELGAAEGEDRAGLGFTGLTWKIPVEAGTTVRAYALVVEHRVTSAGHGLVAFDFRLRGEDDQDVVEFRTATLFRDLSIR